MHKIHHREIVAVGTEVSFMAKPIFPRERRRHPRVLIDLPLEYREVGDTSCRGAYTGDVSKMGLLIHSVDNLLMGAKLEVFIFYADEYRLDIFRVFARIVRKRAHSEPDWKGYKYGLEFIQICTEDRRKLDLLMGQGVVSDEAGSKELRTILNSGPSHPRLILTGKRDDQKGFKEALTQFLEKHFEKIVFALILFAILVAV